MASSPHQAIAPDAYPLRVVFDTNVILSLWAFTDSAFAPMRAAVEAGRWLALTQAECLAEFKRVLTYPQFKFTDTHQAHAFAAYAQTAQTWHGKKGTVELPRCKDRDDQKFLELARDAAADWLVTNDKMLLRMARRDKLRGLFRILKPEAALAELQATAGSPPSP